MSGRERSSLTRYGSGLRPRAGASVWLLALVLLMVLPGATCITAPVEQPDIRLSHALELDDTDALDRRPIRVQSRDGTDLPLVSLEVRGTVEDPLAFTELRLEFENTEPRALDATLEVRLPPKARVTRFAALIEDSWREAEVVERKPGALRPSLYEPAEPAVDPSPDGDQHFVVTLPDVPGRSVQRLILSYTETFEDVDMPYRVRVAGLHDIPRFVARVVVHSQPDPLLEVWAGNRLPEQLGMDEQGRRVLELRRRDWTATEDFVVPTSGLRRTGVRNGRKVAVRINPLTHDHAAPIEGLTILFDTSASRAVGYRHRVEQLAGLVEALHPWTGNELWLRLIAFDQGFETVYEGPLGDIDRGAFDRLLARNALGASNLVSVLRHAGVRASKTHEPAKVGTAKANDIDLDRPPPSRADVNRVILISDGMATAGVSERGRLLEAVAELADADIDRIDVIADHGRRDAWTLRALVRELPESGLVLDASDNPRALVRRLLRTVHDDVKISVPGARWYYPEVVDGVQSDDEILVFADVETLEAGMRVTVESHGKQSWVVPLVEVEEPLVGLALEHARVEFLVTTLEDKAEGQSLVARKQLWRRIVQNSKLNRVVNDYTRLTMLGDRDEYARARLDPARLPEVLVAGPEGVQVRRRGVPNALVEDDVPLARARLPEFPRATLGVDQLVLLAQEDVSSGPSGLSSAEADAVMAVGELVERDTPMPTPLPVLEPPPDSPAAELARMRRAKPLEGRKRNRPRTQPPTRAPEDAYQGNLLTIMNLLEWGDVAAAKEVAWRWREAEPTEVMAVVALGEALEAGAEVEAAARAYGSIIDLYPDRADMRRFAGSRLEHLGSVGARLAIDTYRRARQQRPDHPSSHRLLAFALLRAGREERAFDVLEAGLRRDWSAAFSGAFVGVEKVLREDLGLIAAAWLAHEPDREAEIRGRLEQLGAELEAEPSLRFVLTWETGANDVDLHVRDVLGSHAYYEDRGLRTGGVLYYDVTDGYGPEVFTILGEPSGYPYNLQVHYYARGPNGYGMGKVQIVEHDGRGGVAFDERPFVVMKDRAFVDLGQLEGPMRGQ
ncbi:Vault protein inter-alpha-trypsin [Enhygromyxa salina]|uniref:Vault protein inter-alpha-trypsin n=1 Tax=Enhygromyxa salina TaxID=215803 RepID=A0A2S9YL27_9BACT|nr:VIT domain-containing protein [Enhygromyxa salina]PRQ05793.1 Vault protein inter-alpha-trypsin [Enhygromyxa salina]